MGKEKIVGVQRAFWLVHLRHRLRVHHECRVPLVGEQEILVRVGTEEIPVDDDVRVTSAVLLATVKI